MDFNYSYEYAYEMGETIGSITAAVYLICVLVSLVLGLVSYVLRSSGLHTIAKRRGITNPWLAWIPVVWVWTLGSVSDQYRYVTKGQIKHKRTILLILQIIAAVLSIVVSAVASSGSSQLLAMALSGDESEVMAAVMSLLIQFLGVALVSLCVSIVNLVFYYMALYDLYTSVNPAYSVAFTVLSIIPVVKICEPFFIFFNRNKDLGMPPRCDIPVEPITPDPQFLPPQQPIQEPWENAGEE